VIDVLVEVVDQLALIVDEPRREIAGRHDADELAALDDGQVAHAEIRRERHRDRDRVLRQDRDHVARHHRLDRGELRIAARAEHPHEQVSLRDDADDLVIVDHDERTDVVRVHPVNGRDDELVGSRDHDVRFLTE